MSHADTAGSQHHCRQCKPRSAKYRGEGETSSSISSSVATLLVVLVGQVMQVVLAD